LGHGGCALRDDWDVYRRLPSRSQNPLILRMVRGGGAGVVTGARLL